MYVARMLAAMPMSATDSRRPITRMPGCPGRPRNRKDVVEAHADIGGRDRPGRPGEALGGRDA